MLDNDRIKAAAEKAARVAYTVLGLDCPYSVAFINDPDISEDARLDTQGNVIEINLALLEPFSTDVMPSPEPMTEEEKQLDEDYRHLMKIYSLVYHEMRHLYQKQAVNAYAINKKLGRTTPALESDKKCALWLKELKAPAPGQDIEEDAEDFAYYLTNRFPANLPLQRTNRRIGAMKRKYDKVEIPEDEKKSFTIDTSMNGQYNISEGCIAHHFFQQEEISKGLLVKRHFKEAELSLYTAWVLREGKCYEAIAAWYHKEEDLKDAPHLEKVLHAMEEQLDRLTDGEYSKYATAKDAGEDNLSFKYWSDLQDIYFFIKDLREGKYHGSGSLRYEGRRGIPRIETTGRRLVDSIMGLIWKMDNDAPSTEDELYEAMGRFDDVVNKEMPDFNPEDWE